MYAKLSPRYGLRGWKQDKTMLQSLATNRLRALNNTQFRTLLLCDGETELEGVLDENMQKCLDEYIEKKYVTLSQQPEPIQPEQQYRLYDNNLMETIQWSITGRCNFRCRHCYMDAPDGMFGEVTTAQAMGIIDQMADCGILRVELTGGEPFVRRDFWQIVDRLTERHIRIDQIYSNGWLLTDQVLDELERRGLKPEFSVSFDGIGWHDWMRGVKGAEEAAIAALERCIARGFPVNVEMCLHRGNLRTLRDSLNLLASIGVPDVKVGGVHDSMLWTQNAEGNTLPDNELFDALIEYIPHFYADGMPLSVILGGIASLQKGSKEYHINALRCGNRNVCQQALCPTMKRHGYLAGDGRMLPCISMSSSGEYTRFPNVLETGLRGALSEGFYHDYINATVGDLTRVNEECASCPHLGVCGAGCRAVALLNGDHGLWAPDRTQCMLLKGGYVERIRQVADEAIARYCKDEADEK